MENQASSKNVILNYGLYLGVVSILIAVIKYAMEMQYEQEFYSGIAGILALIVFIILGIKAFKKDNMNILSFGKAVKIGLGITLISTLIIMAYYFLFSTVIEPEFQTLSIESQKTVWADTFGMTPSEIEESAKRANDFFYLSLFGGILIVNLFLGGVISLIAGAVMKRTEEDGY
ncbi:DUF4199 domain-containing protein [Pseudotenacibaculum sp. MALMAid0570]|uniref:DUF4199 domain-containing protein n=1 Tax=Pseudotenacibaculum sp. MALMAid0570 TaxID=3143938 RepID=UPI0032E01ED9